MTEVLLTADRTLMSNYHHNEFLGFGTCAPPNFIPEWLFSYLFFPQIETKNECPWSAPYGLRKIESQLLKNGFNVKGKWYNRLLREFYGGFSSIAEHKVRRIE